MPGREHREFSQWMLYMFGRLPYRILNAAIEPILNSSALPSLT
ncbi:hypothetical protein PSAC2689_100117 [Paraburkholderia sacchari]